MTFTFMDIITILGFCVATITLAFGIIKFVSSQIHGRIDGVENKFDEQLKDIKDNYAHKTNISHLTDLMESVKKDQNRMASRIDDFFKLFINLKDNK